MPVQKIADSLSKKISQPDLVSKLSEELSPSDLNSLLMAVFQNATTKITPAQLLKNYSQNRFVVPSQVDAIAFREFELPLLKTALASGFSSLELSPVSPLGTCSAVATVNQNKIISAGRGTEVVADATNVLALESSKLRKAHKLDNSTVNLCTIHRHVRTQAFTKPGFTAHFKVFCLTSATKDPGSFGFEKQSLLHHLSFYINYLTEILNKPEITIGIKPLKTPVENTLCSQLVQFLGSKLTVPIKMLPVDVEGQAYYQALQFKILLKIDGIEHEIGDGGFVNWSQLLTGNHKERMLISAIGLEFLYKLLHPSA